MQDAPRPAGQEEDPATVKTVLIVEDDADIGEALTAILQDTTPYEVIRVSDGFAALKVVRTLIPQLVLLDYLLPGMAWNAWRGSERAKAWSGLRSFS